MSIASNEKGGSRLKLYLFLLFAFVVIHVGLKVVPLYIGYYRFEDEMKMKAGLAQILKDEEIQKDLVVKAKELDLPKVAIDNLKLERFDEARKMRITSRWDVEVNFFWGAHIRNFHFEPRVEESFMSIRR